VIAILAPGQGSQSPGMLAPWLELPGAREKVDRWSELTGLDLARLGTTADAEEIRDTAVTQPLVVALALLGHAHLRDTVTLPDDPLVAGHSIGELAAAAIAGVLTEDDAVTLAAVRGREMAAACRLAPTGMAAVMGGGERAEVVEWLAGHDLVAANENGAGQIVAAGSEAHIDKLVAEGRPGTKVIKLKVAGAFHTHYMEPARAAMAAHAGSVRTTDATTTLLSNADGAEVRAGGEVLDRLVAQVTRPVRWDACMATMAGRGVRIVVELPPAGALTGLARRELQGVTVLALKTPATAAKLTDALAAAGNQGGDS